MLTACCRDRIKYNLSNVILLEMKVGGGTPKVYDDTYDEEKVEQYTFLIGIIIP